MLPLDCRLLEKFSSERNVCMIWPITTEEPWIRETVQTQWLVQFPAHESPTRGNEIRHIRSVGSSRVADGADDNHPIEKLCIAGLQQLFHGIVDQASSFTLRITSKSLWSKLCVDLPDTRRAGKMRKTPGGENRYPSDLNGRRPLGSLGPLYNNGPDVGAGSTQVFT